MRTLLIFMGCLDLKPLISVIPFPFLQWASERRKQELLVEQTNPWVSLHDLFCSDTTALAQGRMLDANVRSFSAACALGSLFAPLAKTLSLLGLDNLGRKTQG